MCSKLAKMLKKSNKMPDRTMTMRALMRYRSTNVTGVQWAEFGNTPLEQDLTGWESNWGGVSLGSMTRFGCFRERI